MKFSFFLAFFFKNKLLNEILIFYFKLFLILRRDRGLFFSILEFFRKCKTEDLIGFSDDKITVNIINIFNNINLDIKLTRNKSK